MEEGILFVLLLHYRGYHCQRMVEIPTWKFFSGSQWFFHWAVIIFDWLGSRLHHNVQRSFSCGSIRESICLFDRQQGWKSLLVIRAVVSFDIKMSNPFCSICMNSQVLKLSDGERYCKKASTHIQKLGSKEICNITI